MQGQFHRAPGADAHLPCNLRNSTLTPALEVNNIGTVMPPLAPRTFCNQFANTDTGTYSAIARPLYADLSVSR